MPFYAIFHEVFFINLLHFPGLYAIIKVEVIELKWHEKLRFERKKRRLRREDVVEKMRAFLPEGESVSTRTLASWELGDSEPRIRHAVALAKVYHMDDLSQLFWDAPAETALNAEGQALLDQYRMLLLESPRFTCHPERNKKERKKIYDLHL